jgi:Cu(I)/Ag(I) efflux system membrane fusion protein
MAMARSNDPKATSVRWLTTAAIVGGMLLPLSCDKGGDDKAAAAASDGTLLTPYLEIQDTLAHDKIDGLPELGAAVVQAAESKASEPGVDKILQGAGRIASEDIATARTAFKSMSDGMIEYLKAHEDKQPGHTIVHCPMTFKGKGGNWVQKEGDVMNPYEGAMMLHCGDKVKWTAELPKT